MFVATLMLLDSSLQAQDSWRFIAVGDSRGPDNGINQQILTEIAAEIVNQNAEFVVFPGDLVEGYTDQTTLQQQLMNWRNTMQPVYDAGIGVYAVRGNHDLGSPEGVTAWNNVFSGAYAMPSNGPSGEANLTFSATYGNVLVMGFDQYVTPHRVNQDWLDAQLAASNATHVFSFGHEPAFQAQHTDCMDDYPADRNEFWASLADAGSRVYFTGHDHFYDHAGIWDADGNPNNNIHQYIVGTAGAPLRVWSPPYTGSNSPYNINQIHHATQYGYVIVEINGPTATLTWMERTAPGVYSPGGDVWSYTVIPEPSSAAFGILMGTVSVLAMIRNRKANF